MRFLYDQLEYNNVRPTLWTSNCEMEQSQHEATLLTVYLKSHCIVKVSECQHAHSQVAATH